MARVLRGNIYWASLGPPAGREQGRRRPVLVISNDLFNERSGTAVALGITSRRPAAGYPFNWQLPPRLLPTQSWVNIWYVRTLATERLSERIAHLEDDEIGEIIQGLLEIVG